MGHLGAIGGVTSQEEYQGERECVWGWFGAFKGNYVCILGSFDGVYIYIRDSYGTYPPQNLVSEATGWWFIPRTRKCSSDMAQFPYMKLLRSQCTEQILCFYISLPNNPTTEH